MTTIKVRRGTAAQWASAATVLAAGELGLDMTNNILKLGDGSTAWASLPASNSSTYARRAADSITALPTIMAIGDSNTANGGGAYANGQNALDYQSTSEMLFAQVMTDGRFLHGGVSATFGYTAAQIRATHVPVVIAAAPAYCRVLAGTNGWTAADISGIYSDLLAAGITPIACLVPPRNGQSVVALNQYIARQARLLGIPLVDYYTPLVDATTGDYNAAYSGDGIHWNEAGAKLVGQALANVLTARLGAASAGGYLLANSVDTNALVGNACFTTVHASTQPYPPWAVSTGTGWTNTYSTVAGVAGSLFTLTRGSTDAFEQPDVTFTLVAGHKYLFAFKLKSVVKGVGGSAEWRLNPATGAAIYTTGAHAEDMPLGTFIAEWTAPVGLASYLVRPQIRATAAANAATSIGQFTALDLTALGVA